MRHHVRFSGADIALSPDASWGTWGQLCRILVEEFSGGDMLAFIADRLRQEQERICDERRFSLGDFEFKNFRVIVEDQRL